MKRLTAVICLVLSGCSPSVGMMVVNHRDTPIVLVYSVPDRRNCVDKYHPQVPLEQVGGSWIPDEVPQAPTTFNAETCEWRVTVSGKSAIFLGTRGDCLDWRLHEKYPLAPPLFSFMRFETPDGAVEWRGLELLRKFRDEGGFFSREVCRLDFE
jgi:hypothetical protein